MGRDKRRGSRFEEIAEEKVEVSGEAGPHS